MKRIICLIGMAFMLNIAGADAQTVEVKQKRGWSKKAKGATAGAVVGGGVGALVSKNNRLKGAAIGAGVGAGAGYLYGRHRDKKYPAREYKYKRTVKYR
ncbi:MAG: glycine zipper 2TM domain-containing protein [Sphingobacteriales bacterium]|nr:MAG: glycine zipper 2TM domain-containing protein [Sphingobacteriales bacterium]